MLSRRSYVSLSLTASASFHSWLFTWFVSKLSTWMSGTYYDCICFEASASQLKSSNHGCYLSSTAPLLYPILFCGFR